MLHKISTFWIMVLGIMVASTVALGLMAYSAIQTTKTAVEREQIAQLEVQANAHASAINERFSAFENSTKIVAEQAKLLLLNNNLTTYEIQSRLQKYQRDQRNIYGLDIWYQDIYIKQFNNNHLSNVFLNTNTPLTPQIEQEIATTEDLNPLFLSIHESNLGSQWVYLTLPSGMMRLYPWQGNNVYEQATWEPQKENFYTDADALHNPSREAVWTAPYIDHAGAGLMVTNSYPIYKGDTLIGVMSNDFVVRNIQEDVLGFKVGKGGFAFLLDEAGHIIAHQDYQSAVTNVGEEVLIELTAEKGYMTEAVEEMLLGKTGKKKVIDEEGVQWVVVYTPIPITGWNLGLMKPYNEIIQPALEIQKQVQNGFGLLLIMALAVSLIIARWISQPITQLSKKAELISSSVDAMDASIESDIQIPAADMDASTIRGTRETHDLALVFGEMVNSLHKRINELGSIYILGQIIAATIEYEKTIKTVLRTVERTVKSDYTRICAIKNGNWDMDIFNYRAPIAKPLSMSKDLMDKIVAQKSPLLIQDVQHAETDLHQEVIFYMNEKGAQSILAAPLIKNEEPIGLILLENYTKENFPEDALRQITRLNSLATIAIHNAIQVYQREQILNEKIRELKIQINESKRRKDVDQILESDYFQNLQKRVAEMRSRNVGDNK